MARDNPVAFARSSNDLIRGADRTRGKHCNDRVAASRRPLDLRPRDALGQHRRDFIISDGILGSAILEDLVTSTTLIARWPYCERSSEQCT
jgi:hypothetical protein